MQTQEAHQKGYVSHCCGATATESPERRMVGWKDWHLFFFEQIHAKENFQR
jgi:hypothetical protein